jgi:hypothetical protein
METARWLDWRCRNHRAGRVDRLYFGHETCHTALPGKDAAIRFIRRHRTNCRAFTFVTPFMTTAGLRTLQETLSGLSVELDALEVVCNDWGLLWQLTRPGQPPVVPVAGRLLAPQFVDPRYQRILSPGDRSDPTPQVTHLDGTRCRLMRQRPTAALRAHLRSCPLGGRTMNRLLRSLGVRRGELNNPGHGLSLDRRPGFAYSLYVPDVLLSVMRFCPGPGEDFRAPCDGLSGFCRQKEVPWHYKGFPVGLTRTGNALYYKNPRLPGNLEKLPIDRIVYTDSASRKPGDSV